jgi:folate-binding Fe-S cluster repair protein YgfZ
MSEASTRLSAALPPARMDRRAGLSSDEQRAHRLERAVKRIEDETEDLERYDAEQRLRIARLSEDDRSVGLALGQREVALGYRAPDRRAVGQCEVHLPFGNKANGLPHVHGQQRVDRPTVDQEADGSRAGGTPHSTLDVAQAHAPEDGSFVLGGAIGILPGGTE